MPRYLGVARDDSGQVIPTPVVYVYDAGTSDLSTIYSDDDLATTESNPFTGDTDGTYDFYMAPGNYKIKITKTGYSDNESDNITVGIYAEPYAARGGVLAGAKIGVAQLHYYTATPESVITAVPGSLCTVNAGGTATLYIKATLTGNTGWVALAEVP